MICFGASENVIYSVYGNSGFWQHGRPLGPQSKYIDICTGCQISFDCAFRTANDLNHHGLTQEDLDNDKFYFKSLLDKRRERANSIVRERLSTAARILMSTKATTTTVTTTTVKEQPTVQQPEKLSLKESKMKLPANWYDNPASTVEAAEKTATISAIREKIKATALMLSDLKRQLRLSTEGSVITKSVVTKSGDVYLCAFSISPEEGPDLSDVRTWNEDSGESSLSKFSESSISEITLLLRKQFEQ